jgi:uncharacterized protein (DUF433 family)
MIKDKASERRMDYWNIITVDPHVRDGQPCIRGLPITVSDVLGYFASGMSIEQVLAERKQLTREDIVACLEFGAGGSEGGAAPIPHPNSPPPRGPTVASKESDEKNDV